MCRKQLYSTTNPVVYLPTYRNNESGLCLWKSTPEFPLYTHPILVDTVVLASDDLRLM